MAEIPLRYLVHRVDATPYVGTGSTGDVYDTPVTDVPCFRDDRRRLVRNGPGGDQVISETTLYMRLDRAASFVPRSQVDLGDRVAQVITAALRTDGNLGAWQHLEVTLT